MSQEQVAAQVLTLAQLQAMADEEAELGVDMSVASAGGGYQDKRFTPGWTLAYYTGYIEKGSHRSRNPKAGEKNDPKPQAVHTFHLLSDNYRADDGTAYSMDTFDMNISNNEKAGAFLMFKAMNYRGDKKRFPQLLGGLYLVEIIDYLPKSPKPGQEPKSIINTKTIRAPLEPLSGQPYAAPLPLNEAWLKLFMWEKPHLAGWDALYIDGVNETTKKSKNWIQETIVGATNFAGSPLELMLRSSQRPIPQARIATAAATPGAPAAAGALPPGGGIAPPVSAAPNVAPVQPVSPVVAVNPSAVAAVGITAAAPVAMAAVPTPVAPAPVAVVAPVTPPVEAVAITPVQAAAVAAAPFDGAVPVDAVVLPVTP